MPLKKLSEEENASAHELIRLIERKDRRFRLFQTVFMVGTFLALIVIIGSQQRTLDGIQSQQAAQKEFSAEARKERNDQNDSIARRLNCILVFFSLPNRDDLTIEDINRCALNRDKTEQQFFAEPEPGKQEQPPNLTPSASSGNSDNDGAQNPGNDNPGTGNPPPKEDPPVTIHTPIADIPLCVPITSVCIR